MKSCKEDLFSIYIKSFRSASVLKLHPMRRIAMMNDNKYEIEISLKLGLYYVVKKSSSKH
jgi:hypothetical protein